jgi:hypothetical protein
MLAIDDDRIVRIAHFRIADVAQHGVVLEQMGVGPRIGGVVETHHLDPRIETSAEPATREVAADAAESVDRYAQGHGWGGGKTAGKGVSGANPTDWFSALPLKLIVTFIGERRLAIDRRPRLARMRSNQ